MVSEVSHLALGNRDNFWPSVILRNDFLQSFQWFSGPFLQCVCCPTQLQTGGGALQISRATLRQRSPLQRSALCPLGTWPPGCPAQSPQLRETPLLGLGSPLLHCSLETLPRKKSGAVIGLILLPVSQGSLWFVARGSHVLKTFASYGWSIFSVSGGRVNPIPVTPRFPEWNSE